MTETDPRFNVVQFFEDESFEYVIRGTDPASAVDIAVRLTQSIVAKIGNVKRVIITDADDFTNFEWIYGKGVVFPSQEDLL